MATASSKTIFALSSAPGRAGVAVIRVSGPDVPRVLTLMSPPMPDANRAAFRTIRHPDTGEALDKAVVLFFAAPKSETGEDVAEFQVHGGRAVVSAVLGALSVIEGCRMAEPGEFVRRAFLNGKLDLAEVEGLADLVDAETEAQRRQALAQSSGALSKLYEGWRKGLIAAMALVEAAIDFSDEGDVSAVAMAQAAAAVAPLADEIAKHLADGRRGEILREGFRVALLGAPNAGKSSLLNALARRDAAIVSEEAGTTRDVIEVRLDLGGYPVIVSDTAGLRDAQGAVEREGIRRSLAAAERADLVLWLVEPGTEEGNTSAPFAMAATQSESRESKDESRKVSRETAALTLTVRTKSDLAGTRDTFAVSEGPITISAKTGQGLEELVARITAIAADRLAGQAGPPLTQERHRASLTSSLDCLRAFQAGSLLEPELRAEDLRRAAHALVRITGRVDVEDVLGEIFGRFCIGK
jgi:tRNA modification GTPase